MASSDHHLTAKCKLEENSEMKRHFSLPSRGRKASFVRSQEEIHLRKLIRSYRMGKRVQRPINAKNLLRQYAVEFEDNVRRQSVDDEINDNRFNGNILMKSSGNVDSIDVNDTASQTPGSNTSTHFRSPYSTENERANTVQKSHSTTLNVWISNENSERSGSYISTYEHLSKPAEQNLDLTTLSKNSLFSNEFNVDKIFGNVFDGKEDTEDIHGEPLHDDMKIKRNVCESTYYLDHITPFTDFEDTPPELPSSKPPPLSLSREYSFTITDDTDTTCCDVHLPVQQNASTDDKTADTDAYSIGNSNVISTFGGDVLSDEDLINLRATRESPLNNNVYFGDVTSDTFIILDHIGSKSPIFEMCDSVNKREDEAIFNSTKSSSFHEESYSYRVGNVHNYEESKHVKLLQQENRTMIDSTNMYDYFSDYTISDKDHSTFSPLSLQKENSEASEEGHESLGMKFLTKPPNYEETDSSVNHSTETDSIRLQNRTTSNSLEILLEPKGSELKRTWNTSDKNRTNYGMRNNNATFCSNIVIQEDQVRACDKSTLEKNNAEETPKFDIKSNDADSSPLFSHTSAKSGFEKESSSSLLSGIVGNICSSSTRDTDDSFSSRLSIKDDSTSVLVQLDDIDDDTSANRLNIGDATSVNRLSTEYDTSRDSLNIGDGTLAKLNFDDGTSANWLSIPYDTSWDSLNIGDGTLAKFNFDDGSSVNRSNFENCTLPSRLHTNDSMSASRSNIDDGASSNSSNTDNGTSLDRSNIDDGISENRSNIEDGTSTNRLNIDDSTSSNRSNIDNGTSSHSSNIDDCTSAGKSYIGENSLSNSSNIDDGTSVNSSNTDDGTSANRSNIGVEISASRSNIEEGITVNRSNIDESASVKRSIIHESISSSGSNIDGGTSGNRLNIDDGTSENSLNSCDGTTEKRANIDCGTSENNLYICDGTTKNRANIDDGTSGNSLNICDGTTEYKVNFCDGTSGNSFNICDGTTKNRANIDDGTSENVSCNNSDSCSASKQSVENSCSYVTSHNIDSICPANMHDVEYSSFHVVPNGKIDVSSINEHQTFDKVSDVELDDIDKIFALGMLEDTDDAFSVSRQTSDEAFLTNVEILVNNRKILHNIHPLNQQEPLPNLPTVSTALKIDETSSQKCIKYSCTLGTPEEIDTLSLGMPEKTVKNIFSKCSPEIPLQNDSDDAIVNEFESDANNSILPYTDVCFNMNMSQNVQSNIIHEPEQNSTPPPLPPKKLMKKLYGNSQSDEKCDYNGGGNTRSQSSDAGLATRRKYSSLIDGIETHKFEYNEERPPALLARNCVLHPPPRPPSFLWTSNSVKCRTGIEKSARFILDHDFSFHDSHCYAEQFKPELSSSCFSKPLADKDINLNRNDVRKEQEEPRLSHFPTTIDSTHHRLSTFFATEHFGDSDDSLPYDSKCDASNITLVQSIFPKIPVTMGEKNQGFLNINEIASFNQRIDHINDKSSCDTFEENQNKRLTEDFQFNTPELRDATKKQTYLEQPDEELFDVTDGSSMIILLDKNGKTKPDSKISKSKISKVSFKKSQIIEPTISIQTDAKFVKRSHSDRSPQMQEGRNKDRPRSTSLGKSIIKRFSLRELRTIRGLSNDYDQVNNSLTTWSSSDLREEKTEDTVDLLDGNSVSSEKRTSFSSANESTQMSRLSDERSSKSCCSTKSDGFNVATFVASNLQTETLEIDTDEHLKNICFLFENMQQYTLELNSLLDTYATMREKTPDGIRQRFDLAFKEIQIMIQLEEKLNDEINFAQNDIVSLADAFNNNDFSVYKRYTVLADKIQKDMKSYSEYFSENFRDLSKRIMSPSTRLNMYVQILRSFQSYFSDDGKLQQAINYLENLKFIANTEMTINFVHNCPVELRLAGLLKYAGTLQYEGNFLTKKNYYLLVFEHVLVMTVNKFDYCIYKYHFRTEQCLEIEEVDNLHFSVKVCIDYIKETVTHKFKSVSKSECHNWVSELKRWQGGQYPSFKSIEVNKDLVEQHNRSPRRFWPLNLWLISPQLKSTMDKVKYQQASTLLPRRGCTDIFDDFMKMEQEFIEKLNVLLDNESMPPPRILGSILRKMRRFHKIIFHPQLKEAFKGDHTNVLDCIVGNLPNMPQLYKEFITVRAGLTLSMLDGVHLKLYVAPFQHLAWLIEWLYEISCIPKYHSRMHGQLSILLNCVEDARATLLHIAIPNCKIDFYRTGDIQHVGTLESKAKCQHIKNGSRYYSILFENVILLTKLRMPSYEFVQALWLDQIHFGPKADHEKTFKIEERVYKKENTYIFKAETTNQRDEWTRKLMELLRKQANSVKRRVSYHNEAFRL